MDDDDGDDDEIFSKSYFPVEPLFAELEDLRYGLEQNEGAAVGGRVRDNIWLGDNLIHLEDGSQENRDILHQPGNSDQDVPKSLDLTFPIPTQDSENRDIIENITSIQYSLTDSTSKLLEAFKNVRKELVRKKVRKQHQLLQNHLNSEAGQENYRPEISRGNSDLQKICSTSKELIKMFEEYDSDRTESDSEEQVIGKALLSYKTDYAHKYLLAKKQSHCLQTQISNITDNLKTINKNLKYIKKNEVKPQFENLPYEIQSLDLPSTSQQPDPVISSPPLSRTCALRSYKKKRIYRIDDPEIFPSTIVHCSCRCQDEQLVCINCNGQYDYTRSVNPPNMTLNERLEILDPEFHSRLSRGDDLSVLTQWEQLRLSIPQQTNATQGRSRSQKSSSLTRRAGKTSKPKRSRGKTSRKSRSSRRDSSAHQRSSSPEYVTVDEFIQDHNLLNLDISKVAVEVPRFRIQPLTSQLSVPDDENDDDIEDTSDQAFINRHRKYEAEEKERHRKYLQDLARPTSRKRK